MIAFQLFEGCLRCDRVEVCVKNFFLNEITKQEMQEFCLTSGPEMGRNRSESAGAERLEHSTSENSENLLTSSEFLSKMRVTNGCQDSLDIVRRMSIY